MRPRVLGVLLTVLVVGPVYADPVVCQKQIAGQLRKYKKIFLKAHVKCLDAENVGKAISGPSCPDAVANFKIQTTNDKVATKIATACSMADIAALGFLADCAYEATATGIEGQCAALPVTTPTEFAECLKCWKSAELSEFIAIVYASHALEVCGGALDQTSTVCSDLPCTTPLPDQRDLGDTAENDCQRGIGKAATKYLVAREKTLEKCALKGGTRTTCLNGSFDPKVPLMLAGLSAKKDTYIMNKCGNRDPVPSPPFCCKTGPGNACMAAADRTDCEVNLGGMVQEGKVCNAGNCDPTPGQQAFTWWGFCPQQLTCPGAALTSLQDLIDCVDSSADLIADELLCLQFRGNGGADWPCPPDAS
jgi:hypothetical protein